MICRHCNTELNLVLADLGSAPPSNALLTEAALHAPEKWFPLRVLVCQKCWLAQTEDFTQANELFADNYPYFSSYSDTWLEHAKKYVSDMIGRFNLTPSSHVVEIAANDGYLLQYFKARGIPCMGVEPTKSTASAARDKGICIVEAFFGKKLARELSGKGLQADLMVANNVLAHVPDINDFVRGFTTLLKPQGVATFEFPHLMRLIEGIQFDTIYHEHFSYLSLNAVARIFDHNGLTIFDVEELPTHGGSLRVFAQLKESGRHDKSIKVSELLDCEKQAGMLSTGYYAGFQRKIEKIKDDFLMFLLEQKRLGKKVVAYGAAAKGNTLLNFAGVRPDLLPCVADQNPTKQGKFMPGSRIPIVNEAFLKKSQPDYIFILIWNLKNEIIKQLSYVGKWPASFVVMVPRLEVFQVGEV